MVFDKFINGNIIAKEIFTMREIYIITISNELSLLTKTCSESLLEKIVLQTLILHHQMKLY